MKINGNSEGGTGGGLTPQQEALLNQVPNKVNQVRLVTDGQAIRHEGALQPLTFNQIYELVMDNSKYVYIVMDNNIRFRPSAYDGTAIWFDSSFIEEGKANILRCIINSENRVDITQIVVASEDYVADYVDEHAGGDTSDCVKLSEVNHSWNVLVGSQNKLKCENDFTPESTNDDKNFASLGTVRNFYNDLAGKIVGGGTPTFNINWDSDTFAFEQTEGLTKFHEYLSQKVEELFPDHQGYPKNIDITINIWDFRSGLNVYSINKLKVTLMGYFEEEGSEYSFSGTGNGIVFEYGLFKEIGGLEGFYNNGIQITGYMDSNAVQSIAQSYAQSYAYSTATDVIGGNSNDLKYFTQEEWDALPDEEKAQYGISMIYED